MTSINKIADKVKIDNPAGNGKVEVEVNNGQTVIKSDALEITGTLTNNGQPIGGGTPGDGKLSITVNGNTQFSQGFSANQSENVNASLTTGLITNYSTSSTPTLTPFLFMECRTAVTTLTLATSNLVDFSTNEYACTFSPASTSITVSLSGYTLNWIDGSEDPTDLDITKSYIMSIIVPKNGSSLTNAYGIIKKIS